MSPIKILDASLRDGGHRTNFHFSDEELKNILEPLDQTGLNYIEIGYRNGSLHPIENLGRAGYCHKDYLLQCQSLIRKSNIAVMVHPKNTEQSDLEELKDCGVQLLRICIAKNDLDSALPIISMAKKNHLEISLNFIHLSYYSDDELANIVKQASQYEPDMIYFADSNGTLFPQKIKAIYEQYTKKYAIPFGFHAHDNLGLAQANAIAAIEAGASLIDTSLAGMGKGIGNLKTEFFIAYLHALDIKTYSLEHALLAANYVRTELNIGHEAIEMGEFIRGITNLSTADLKRLQTQKTSLQDSKIN